jgi:hypothetical protein
VIITMFSLREQRRGWGTTGTDWNPKLIKGRPASVNRKASLSPTEDETHVFGRARAPACPFSRSRGVNSGHSCHVPTLTRRSALALVRTLIAARSSKLAMLA